MTRLRKTQMMARGAPGSGALTGPRRSEARRLLALVVSLLFVGAISGHAVGDNVPFAAPPSSRLGSSSEAYYASLSDIMSVIQLRHIKLWHAGTSGDWHVVSFETNQIKDTFLKAAMFYKDLPVANVMSVQEPLDGMRQAAETGDRPSFIRSFEALTNACNQCHKAAQVGFIVIQTPTFSPFTDQKF